MIALDVIHAFAVTSRSGRAVAILGEDDMEARADEDVVPNQIIQRLAAVAHPVSDWNRHVSLRHGLESAYAISERVPGNVACAAVKLDDGRKAVVLRHVAGDDAVERLKADGIQMEEDEQWTSSASRRHAPQP